jgi:small subunit ribosomal protein S6
MSTKNLSPIKTLQKEMDLYEIVFIARQELQREEIQIISNQYKEHIQSLGSELKKFEYWGLRSLAYEINKNKKGHYLFYVIKAGSKLSIKNIINKLRYREEILRFAFFKTKFYDSKPSLMMQTPSN